MGFESSMIGSVSLKGPLVFRPTDFKDFTSSRSFFKRIKSMDLSNRGSELRRGGSYGRTISAGSSMRRSSSLPLAVPFEIDDDIDSESVSEAGDIGDRALHSKRLSVSGSNRFSIDNGGLDRETSLTIQEQEIMHSYGFWSYDPKAQNATSAVTPMPEENVSPLQTQSLVQPDDKQGKDEAGVLPVWVEYISSLIHLAVFGILGVLTRYLLQKLFGPDVADVTSDNSILYLDLPSNMVGSFLMGWFGVVFKPDISKVSDFLAMGLSTGYLGSVTTFSGWNQKMLDLSVEGLWVRAVLGFLLGLFLAAFSIIFGVETARGFRLLLQRLNQHSSKETSGSSSKWMINSVRRHLIVLLGMLLILGALLAVSAALLKKEFKTGSSEAQLWLGCLVAPLGVWMRWFLARLNGQGIGKAQRLKWVPFGTLLANVSAACVMAALATLKKAVHTRNCNTVASGIQLGLLGCLSTVSTFIAEFNAMRESKYPWRAYAYALFTIFVSFTMGILIYSVPVWAKGFD